jgi:outer membrane receptor protein involved in Fe transport
MANRNRKIQIIRIIILGLCVGIPAESKEGDVEPGQLKGKLIDQTTRQPLIFANVTIEGIDMGAATDTAGVYVIKNVTPGIYNVRYQMMGYETRLVNQVIVNPARTTWQQIEMESTVLEGEGVMVTAGYFQNARDAIVSSRSVDYQELRADPGSAEDIQRVMQALPAVVSEADQSNEILVRGGMPGENLFLMDGIEIPNPNHFAEQGTSGGPINMVDPNFVRQIDFYAGAFPARYGDKASSAMDIVLREGDREAYTGHGYMGMAGAGMIVEGPVNHGKGSFIISGRRSYLDLILSGIGMDVIPHYHSFQSKWVYDINKENKLIFNVLYGADFIEGDETSDSMDEEPDTYRWKHDGGQQVWGLSWQRLLGDKGYVRTQFSQVKADWDVWTTKNNQPYYKNGSMEQERTLKTDLVYLPIHDFELQTGVQIKKINFHIMQWVQGDTIFINEFDDNGFIVSEEIFQVYDSFLQNRYDQPYKEAVYLHGKWLPSSKWTCSAGLRGDYFSFTKKKAVDPRLGLSYHWSPVTSISLAFGQQSQAPSYLEVTAHPANHDFEFKRTRQAVFGIDHLFREDTRATLEVFYKDYDRVPIGISERTPDPFDVSDGRGVSEGRGFARGLEFFLQKKPTGRCHFTVSYAYSVSKAEDPRNGRIFNWDYDYRHIFTIMGGIQLHLNQKSWYQKLKKNRLYRASAWLLPLADELEISCRWRYLGGRPYTRPNYHPELRMWVLDEDVAVNDHRYPAYHRLDIRVDKRFMFNGWNIVMYIDLMNVYNRKNIWEYSYQGDGDVETLNQFSFLPVGGITVEF